MECLQTLSEFCERSVLALGESEDKTEEKVRPLTGLDIIETTWDRNLMGDGGQILSQQTNVALDYLKKKYDKESSWGFYLQSDDVDSRKRL